ncbi:hypothetical protein ESB00_17840 [Oleiharenicola lentus]|uniref:Uncharacterized protein n=1 Tax=Oleiharenicola lentus TaxID=2508720 RepID=A0A4Q1C5F0_9BACT|nr:hypothetical protein [Oleiharenicola lentus]RXK53553.1 hypothetical protein ESB00_17840 [Oleiharenicola lentus]
MNAAKKTKLLKVILSDAYLVDVDFAEWDSGVNIYVLSDHIMQNEKRSLWMLQFVGVRDFTWKFPHHDFRKFKLGIRTNRHLIWNIYRCELSRGREIRHLEMSGGEQFPSIALGFEDFFIVKLAQTTFSEINPEWANLSRGLARPSIGILNQLWKGGARAKPKR